MKITESNGNSINFSSLGFSGGERHIQLESLPAQPELPINIRASILNSDDLMDLLLVNSALEENYGKPVSINLEIPYLPYSRQDRVCAEGQAFSLKVFANLIDTLSVNSLVTWDCHSQTGLDVTNAKNISPSEIILASKELTTLLQNKSTVLVCPDKGAIARCEKIKQDLDVNKIVYCEKVREPSTGTITHTNVLSEDLSGFNAVITDDICDGGYTFIKIAEQLREKNAEKIILYVTHGIFSKGIEVFDELIDEIYTTTSFPQVENKKLSVINYSSDIGGAI